MIVEQLLLIRTGTYDDMYIRPYVMRPETHHVLQLREQTQNGLKTEATNLAGVAGQILAPSAAPIGVAGIEAGWGQSRCRFLMRVRHEGMSGESQIQYLTGYTDYDGVNEFSRTIDGKMRFFINNVVTTRVFNTFGAGGAAIPQLRVKEANQLLVGGVVNDFRQLGQAMHTMRPEDVFAQIGAQHEDPSLGPVTDIRTSFHATPLRLSRRTNSSPTDYMSTILSTYRTSVRSADNVVHDWTGMANHMSGVVRESSPITDPFIGEMIRFGTSLSEGSSFTYDELMRHAKYVDHNTTIVGLSLEEKAALPTRSLGSQDSVGSPWLSQHFEPQIATIASHAIMALMAESMLTSITFHLTNRNVGGVPTMNVGVAVGFVQGVDLRDYVNTVIQRTLAGTFRDLTRNGHLDLTISGTLDMVGNSQLTIQYQDRPPVPFNNPTFADSSTSPIVAYDQINVANMAMDIDTLANQLTIDLSPEAYGPQGGSYPAPQPIMHANPIGFAPPAGGGGTSGPAI